MDQKLQDKFRIDISEEYLKKAFECFAQYTYWGEKYAAIKKQVDDYEEKIKKANEIVKELEALPDHHTVVNREKIKAQRNDSQMYRRHVDTIAGEKGVMKKLFEKSVKWRTDGAEILEQAEYIKAFKLKTPEEIAASKQHKCATEGCENMIVVDKANCLHHEENNKS